MENTALLIVHVQNELVADKSFNLDKTLFNIKKLLDTCRLAFDKGYILIMPEYTSVCFGKLG